MILSIGDIFRSLGLMNLALLLQSEARPDQPNEPVDSVDRGSEPHGQVLRAGGARSQL